MDQELNEAEDKIIKLEMQRLLPTDGVFRYLSEHEDARDRLRLHLFNGGRGCADMGKVICEPACCLRSGSI